MGKKGKLQSLPCHPLWDIHVASHMNSFVLSRILPPRERMWGHTMVEWVQARQDIIIYYFAPPPTTHYATSLSIPSNLTHPPPPPPCPSDIPHIVRWMADCHPRTSPHECENNGAEKRDCERAKLSSYIISCEDILTYGFNIMFLSRHAHGCPPTPTRRQPAIHGEELDGDMTPFL